MTAMNNTHTCQEDVHSAGPPQAPLEPVFMIGVGIFWFVHNDQTAESKTYGANIIATTMMMRCLLSNVFFCFLLTGPLLLVVYKCQMMLANNGSNF